ncbi:MAG: chromosome segregation protein SMC [Vampirovibrio sp.]
MHIQQIEIDNFKSFHGKTLIPFRRGFTTVSGPNGSGKSNIVDGILFCLGLSSSRTMRAEKLTDLINNTSRRREATVTITFNKGGRELPDSVLEGSFTEDETQKEKTLALLASLESSELLTVARRIKASASTYSSTYYLNGKASTLGEIHDVLALYHVSPGSYNVMMQGDVAAIVNMSAVERRKIVDELAGVADYDRKIEQALKEIATTADNIERHDLLLGEIKARLSELEGERDKAIQYQDLRQQVQTLEATLDVLRLKNMKNALALEHQALADAKTARQTARAQLDVLDEDIKNATAELKRLAEEIRQQGESQYEALHSEMETLYSQQARKEEMGRGLAQRILDAEQGIEKLAREKEQIQGWMTDAAAQIEIFQTQESELKSLWGTQKKRLDQANLQMEQLSSQDESLIEARQDLRRQLEALEDQVAQTHRDTLSAEAERLRLKDDVARLEQGALALESRQQSLLQRQVNIRQGLKDLSVEKEALDAWVGKALEDKTVLVSKLNQVNQGLFQRRERLATCEAQRQAYEEINHSRSVKSILEAGIHGVHGTLSSLASVEADYETALEIALGGRMQNIIVDDEQVAKQGIQLLQQNRAGRATFLPLTKIKAGMNHLNHPPQGSGVIDFAVRLLQYEAAYDTVFRFALGDTLIVRDLDAAKPFMNRFRMVTLDGALLEKSGAMTGGSRSQMRSGKSGFGTAMKDSQTDVEISQLRHDVQRFSEEKQKIEQHLQKLEQALQDKQAQLHILLPKYSRFEAENNALDTQLKDTHTTHTLEEEDPKTSLLAQLEGLDTHLEALQVQRQSLATAQSDLKEQLHSLDAQLSQDEVALLKEAISEAQFQKEAYDAQLRDVQGQLMTKERELEIRRDSINEKTEQQAQHAQQQKAWQAEILTHQADIVVLKSQYKALENEINALGAGVKTLKAEQDTVQKQLIQLEKTKVTIERALHEAEEALIRTQAKVRESEPQIDALYQQLQAVYPDLEERLAHHEEGDASANAVQRIQRLQRKMADLEPVNMKAIEEFSKVSQRQNELQDKVQTLDQERHVLNSRIEGYEAMKRQYFVKAFDSVNQQFQSIYAELSDGFGQLILTSPEDPFQGGLTIEASPRGKKTQRIEAMSGGEKSLTSLAFVFALQRTMPAPFYALDEVDQNLDGINVEKLSNMVERESQHAQFIVVSLRKPMIENSDRTVGVTQRKNGISKVTGIQLRPDREPNPSANHQDLSPTKRLSQRDEAFASMPSPPRGQKRIVPALN